MLWFLTLITTFAAVMADAQTASKQASSKKDIGPLIKLQNAAVDLGTQIQKVTKDFNTTGSLDASSTLKVATPLTQMIPVLNTVLSDLGAAKPQFDKAILDFLSASCIIKGHITHLKQVADALVGQVQLSVFPAFAGVVAPLAKQVDAAFDAQLNGPYAKVVSLYIPFKL